MDSRRTSDKLLIRNIKQQRRVGDQKTPALIEMAEKRAGDHVLRERTVHAAAADGVGNRRPLGRRRHGRSERVNRRNDSWAHHADAMYSGPRRTTSAGYISRSRASRLFSYNSSVSFGGHPSPQSAMLKFDVTGSIDEPCRSEQHAGRSRGRI